MVFKGPLYLLQIGRRRFFLRVHVTDNRLNYF